MLDKYQCIPLYATLLPAELNAWLPGKTLTREYLRYKNVDFKQNICLQCHNINKTFADTFSVSNYSYMLDMWDNERFLAIR
jgi:hypothetical protein